MSDTPVDADRLEVVLRYHRRTKHHPDHYARSLGFMDWANQPDPFRRFAGAPLLRLAHPHDDPGPTYDALFDGSWAERTTAMSHAPAQSGAERAPPQAGAADLLRADQVSAFFYYGLALSAWKATAGGRWSLRVNPSSGNLHPTEGYLIGGPIEGLTERPAVMHYAPFEHGLEVRRWIEPASFRTLCEAFGAVGLVALSSIHWRESWKYGERAYRYCQHDVGHAIGALSLSAARLGWRLSLIESVGDTELVALLGLDAQTGVEAEHPDVLLAIVAPDSADHGFFSGATAPHTPGWREAIGRIGVEPLLGEPKGLSRAHHPWPVIDGVSRAGAKPSAADCDPTDAHGPSGGVPGHAAPVPEWAPAWPGLQRARRRTLAGRLIRRRRSAVNMDGRVRLRAADFYLMLARTLPSAHHPVWRGWPWPARVHLALFVHRVDGLAPGLYLLVRRSGAEDLLRGLLSREFAFSGPPGVPEGLGLYLLQAGDCRATANAICCHQEIAEAGAFAVAMLAEFGPQLTSLGPWFYRRLFWETGLIGQQLYLEAEAAGVRGTGIGCFFDDVLHTLLGLEGQAIQSLYHFTVGGAVDDARLRTLEAYGHLDRV
ncbi:MAG: nitroreductase family protein [Candidatus Thiosymbion ectosymbiont of Robbea hypermnestra]|nr:nitroreductase family protein [Candidatus Thiosymbion ectosymbiont of Robbea hypermnestra]